MTTTTSSTLNFLGVGSGNDWGSLVDQLVTAEKIPATTLTKKKTDANTQLSLVGNFVTRLTTLATEAQKYTVSASSVWNVATTSSDTSRVTATASGSGTPGSYTLKVTKLAQGETREGTGFNSSAAGAAGAGTIKIGIGTGTKVQVDYSTSDSLADIAARINSKVPGVTAAAVYDGTQYHLTLSSNTTGASNGMSITDTGGLGLADPSSIIQPADNASIVLNGVSAQTTSNHITDLIPGVTLDLQSTTPPGGSATLISVNRDSSAVSSKVQTLVNDFNSIASLIGSQLSYTGTVRGGDTLFGDPIITALQRELGGAVAQSFTHNGTQMSPRELGITMNADGSLALDTSVLAGKIASDPSAVEDMLTGPNGLAAKLNAVATRYTSTQGALLTRESSLRDTMKSYDDQISQINDRADQLKTRLTNQFSALDQLLATYTANANAISSMTKL